MHAGADYTELKMSTIEKIGASLVQLIAAIFAGIFVGVPSGAIWLIPFNKYGDPTTYTAFWVVFGIIMIIALVMAAFSIKEIWTTNE